MAEIECYFPLYFTGHQGQVPPGVRAPSARLVHPLGGDGSYRPRRPLQGAQVCFCARGIFVRSRQSNLRGQCNPIGEILQYVILQVLVLIFYMLHSFILYQHWMFGLFC